MVDMFLFTDMGHKGKMLLSIPFSQAMWNVLCVYKKTNEGMVGVYTLFS